MMQKSKMWWKSVKIGQTWLNMQAVPLAGSIFLCLLGSYRLATYIKEQDNRSFILEIFLTINTMTKAS